MRLIQYTSVTWLWRPSTAPVLKSVLPQGSVGTQAKHLWRSNRDVLLSCDLNSLGGIFPLNCEKVYSELTERCSPHGKTCEPTYNANEILPYCVADDFALQ